MKTNFDITTSWLLVHEGGYVDNPKDPGGATNYGVTQKTYDGYRKRMGLPTQTVRSITMDEVLAIYKTQYWEKIMGDELPAGLDYAVYDFAVNSGPKRAVQCLQELLGANVKADGIMGNQTLGALAELGPEDMRALIEAYCEKRLNWMKTLKTFATFGTGWTRRVMGEQLGVQDADTGVIDRAVKLYMGRSVTAPVRAAVGKAVEEDTKMTVKVAEGFNLSTVGTVAAGIAPTAVIAMIQQEGPIQYALAVVVVIATILGAVVFYKKVISKT
jgi:lysozyme family protein